MKKNQSDGGGYYHICSDGNYASVLFLNPDDFKAAMNRVAGCALRLRVIILAFVLMDNHFHFIIRAPSEDEAYRFAQEFKRLTGLYQTEKYHRPSSLKKLPVKVLPIADEEALKTQLCYVLKNPTKARIGMFYDYPWGTGALYFRKDGAVKPASSAASFTQDTIRMMCRTRVAVPPDWRICDGILIPENYVPVEEVEQLFRTPRSFMYYLSLNKDDEIEQAMGQWNELRLTDRELRQERDMFAKEKFGTSRLRDLSLHDRIKVARYLRHKYLCSKKQVARIVQLPFETIGKVL
ncbi:MAG: hypothetical protein K6G79_06110 [Bacteroidales bacterium]|nr:hypothetical protein [Bacteroidales bacterium]